MDQSGVSVLIAAYNVENYIERAIDSVMAQSVQPFEIIVVDDCSTDGTKATVERMKQKHPCVQLVSLSENSGPARARNQGIDHAKGRWLAVLDADDAWMPDRLERMLAVADESEADFIADNQILFDLDAKAQIRRGFDVKWSVASICAADMFANDLAEKSPLNFGLLKPLVRKQFIDRVGLRYDENQRYGEDFKFAVEIMLRGGRARLMSYAGYLYSVRIGSVSGKKSSGSRTTPKFDSLVASSDKIASEYRDVLDAYAVSCIAKRRKFFATVHKSNEARLLRQRGKWAEFLMLLLTDSQLGALYARRTIERLSRRLGLGKRTAGPAIVLVSAPDTGH